MIKKDYEYYWNHPDEYPRLKADDLKYENTIFLCEFILSGLREEMETTIDMTKRVPKDEEIRHKAIVLKHDLTYGHGSDLVDELVRRCPKGVFDEDDSERKNEKVERRKRHNIKTDVNPLRYKRVVAGPY